MSRIGKSPIKVPAGVTVKIDGQTVSVKGPKGELSRTFRREISVEQTESEVNVIRRSEDRLSRSLHGLSRTLLNNMVVGVSQGFEKKLIVTGVGYRCALDAGKLIMQLGYSHPVEIEIPKGIEVAVQTKGGNVITISGYDRQQLGDFAAFVREKRPPEVYKGKGIRYENEVIRRKAGKAAGSK